MPLNYTCNSNNRILYEQVVLLLGQHRIATLWVCCLQIYFLLFCLRLLANADCCHVVKKTFALCNKCSKTTFAYHIHLLCQLQLTC